MNSQELESLRKSKERSDSRSSEVGAEELPDDDLKTPTIEELAFPGTKVRNIHERSELSFTYIGSWLCMLTGLAMKGCVRSKSTVIPQTFYRFARFARWWDDNMRLISFFPLSLPKALEDGSSSSSGSSSGYGSQNAVKIEEKNPGKKTLLLCPFHCMLVFYLSYLYFVCVHFFVRFYYQHYHLQDWQLLHLQTLQFTYNSSI